MDADELQAFIVNAVQQGTQALSAQVEDLNNQVQALQQTSSGHQAPASQDDEPSHQSRDSHSDNDGEGEHDEPSVEEPSGTVVNVRVPTEHNLSGSHHSVIPQVGQETPLQPGMHSPFLIFPNPEKFTGKSTDSNEVENWIFAMDNLFVAQGNFLTEGQKLAYAVGFLTEGALTWWLAERISPDAPHTWTALKLALLSYFVSPVKVSDAKDKLLSLNQKSAEGISEYVTEFQRLLILAQISNETDKVYTFLRGLRRFTAGSVRMHKPNTLQEAIRLALEFEAAFKGIDSQRGFKRSNESGSIQPAGKRSKTNTGNRNGGGSMGRTRPFGFHRGDRKAQPQTVAERYQKTPAEIEALKRQNACFICGQKGHMAQACKSKN